MWVMVTWSRLCALLLAAGCAARSGRRFDFPQDYDPVGGQPPDCDVSAHCTRSRVAVGATGVLAAGTAILAFSGPLFDYHPCGDAEGICIHPAFLSGAVTTIPLFLAIYFHQRAVECDQDRRAWDDWQRKRSPARPSR